MNAITAQALRSITGEGSSTRNSSPLSPFNSSNFHTHASTNHVEPRLSIEASLDSAGNSPVFSMGAFTPSETVRPNLSLLTDIGRKYPGFPTPLSPTPSAKEIYPTPTSERAMSPVVRSASPMSIDGSEMCGPSRRCNSHGFQHYASTMGLIDSVIAQPSPQPQRFYTPPSTPSQSPLRALSPRSTMLKTLHAKPPHMAIANGDLVSPLSPPSTTILSYTSHRPIMSGLLALPPLNENQVAEYRFWTPCDRRVCEFGCGSKNEGECSAQKRLFRGVEECAVDEGIRGGDEIEEGLGDMGEMERQELEKSEWAGRRYVGDWEAFLRGCEREGVARY